MGNHPRFANWIGRDGRSCNVWRNPPNLGRTVAAGVPGIRGLLTAADLFVWHGTNIVHADFEQQTDITGVRLKLRPEPLGVNHETVALPEYFPWNFSDTIRREAMDIEERRSAVAA